MLLLSEFNTAKAQRFNLLRDDYLSVEFSNGEPSYTGENAGKALDKGASLFVQSMNRIVSEGKQIGEYYSFYNTDVWFRTMDANNPVYSSIWHTNRKPVSKAQACLNVDYVTWIERLGDENNSWEERMSANEQELKYLESIQQKIQTEPYASAKVELLEGEKEIKHRNDRGWSIKYCLIMYYANQEGD